MIILRGLTIVHGVIFYIYFVRRQRADAKAVALITKKVGINEKLLVSDGVALSPFCGITCQNAAAAAAAAGATATQTVPSAAPSAAPLLSSSGTALVHPCTHCGKRERAADASDYLPSTASNRALLHFPDLATWYLGVIFSYGASM